MKKIFIILSLIAILSTTATASFIENDSSFDNSEDLTIIKGKVEAKVTCRPNPLSGALVTAKSINPLYFNKKYSDVSDADGNFTIELPPGTYRLNVEREGYRLSLLSSNRIIEVESGETYEIIFSMFLSNSKSLIFFPRILSFLFSTL